MSYKTNGQAFRLGFSNTWIWHSQQNRNYLFEKIKNYLIMIFYQSTVLEVKKRSKKKKKKFKSFKKYKKKYAVLVLYWKVVKRLSERLKRRSKFFYKKNRLKYFREKKISNFIPGRFLIEAKTSFFKFFFFFFLNLLQTSIYFERRLIVKFNKALPFINKLLGKNFNIYLVNSYLFAWKMRLARYYKKKRLKLKKKKKKRRRRTPWWKKKIYKKLKPYILYNKSRVKTEKIYYSRFKFFFKNYLKQRYSRRFKRNRYFQTTWKAMLMLFIFPFDVQLLATIIAQELARLRQFHKYYLDFIKKTLSYGLAFFGKKYLYGLKIVIKGQLTSYRRRMKRSQLIAFRIGNFLKSHQEASVLFAFERSFNRYGILGVSVSAQFRSLRKHFTGYIENSKSINKSLLKNLTSGFLKNPNLYLSEWENLLKHRSLDINNLDLLFFWNKRKVWVGKKKKWSKNHKLIYFNDKPRSLLKVQSLKLEFLNLVTEINSENLKQDLSFLNQKLSERINGKKDDLKKRKNEKRLRIIKKKYKTKIYN